MGGVVTTAPNRKGPISGEVGAIVIEVGAEGHVIPQLFDVIDEGACSKNAFMLGIQEMKGPVEFGQEPSGIPLFRISVPAPLPPALNACAATMPTDCIPPLVSANGNRGGFVGVPAVS